MKKLASVYMPETFFTFKGHFFKATKGTPTGNPLFPLISEVIMGNLEKKTVTSNTNPRDMVYRRCIILAIVKHNENDSSTKYKQATLQLQIYYDCRKMRRNCISRPQDKS